jgi:hypothetical protein
LLFSAFITISITGQISTLSIKYFQHNYTKTVEGRAAECCIFIYILIVVMLSVVMLGVLAPSLSCYLFAEKIVGSELSTSSVFNGHVLPASNHNWRLSKGAATLSITTLYDMTREY